MDFLPRCVHDVPIIPHKSPGSAFCKDRLGVVHCSLGIHRRDLSRVDRNDRSFPREEGGKVPGLVGQFRRGKAVSLRRRIGREGFLLRVFAHGEIAVVLLQNGQDAVGIGENFAVIQDPHRPENDRQHQQQRHHGREDQFYAQCAYHSVSSSVYPAFRMALIWMFACRTASFFRR